MCPPLTGPPSAPQNLVYNINQTTVNLEWSPPADTGGRNDVTYRVICRRCSWEPEECVPCGPNVGYSPAQSGLVDTYVSITDLLAHANYTLEVEAVNGVSDLSRTQRLFAAVSIATGQAGLLILLLHLKSFFGFFSFLLCFCVKTQKFRNASHKPLHRLLSASEKPALCSSWESIRHLHPDDWQFNFENLSYTSPGNDFQLTLMGIDWYDP